MKKMEKILDKQAHFMVSIYNNVVISTTTIIYTSK